MSQTRRLAAIMFTDIVGYTALMGNDESKAFYLLKRNREIQKPIVEEFGGTWIKELGDGVMMSFNTVSDAVYAAIKIQENCNQAKEFQLRIGIHFGEVVFESEDVFGDVVNIASRLQTLAPASAIWISEAVHHNIANKQGIVSRYIKQETLKNVREPVNIYEVFDEASGGVSTATVKKASVAILPDFEYDIYLSYRANDNKSFHGSAASKSGSGWVSELVEKLKQELEATIKDKLSIHFDRSPDELTDSESSPLRALIFIPIISQTYCDINSRVWIDEFQVFKSESEKDRLGTSILLPTGNRVSRILPIKIHDLDPEDVQLLETELSGDLRSIDFIYRQEGVNRPLRPADDEFANDNSRIWYRNQINKLANAIKEIINGLKAAERAAKNPDGNQDFSLKAVPVKNFITSLPSSIQVQVIDRSRPGVFLAWTSADIKEQREEMAIILQKAGFNVFPTVDCPSDDEAFKNRVAENMAKCSCSLHLLSGEFGRRFESDDEVSFPQYQFMEARKRMETDPDFNSFIWIYPGSNQVVKAAQQNFIKYIRNNITRNMMFSNSAGPMQLIDDMRIVMMKQDAAVYDSKDTDIFFIFNQQDEVEAKVITDKIGLEYPVEIMNIMPDSPDQYREISSQQIPKSKLAVVYFKYAADWALPFIKQIWKEVGGASSPTPLFLVGDDEPKSNLARIFKAPKVVSTVVPKERIPAEVKKVYTTVIELK